MGGGGDNNFKESFKYFEYKACDKKNDKTEQFKKNKKSLFFFQNSLPSSFVPARNRDTRIKRKNNFKKFLSSNKICN